MNEEKKTGVRSQKTEEDFSRRDAEGAEKK
jgi:hypothetical protein